MNGSSFANHRTRRTEPLRRKPPLDTPGRRGGRPRLLRRRGTTAIEYALLLSVLFLAVVVAVQQLGPAMGSSFQALHSLESSKGAGVGSASLPADGTGSAASNDASGTSSEGTSTGGTSSGGASNTANDDRPSDATSDGGSNRGRGQGKSGSGGPPNGNPGPPDRAGPPDRGNPGPPDDTRPP